MNCEICGKEAVVKVNDLVELAPLELQAGTNWATWRVDTSHWFCREHRRKPSRKRLPAPGETQPQPPVIPETTGEADEWTG